MEMYTKVLGKITYLMVLVNILLVINHIILENLVRECFMEMECSIVHKESPIKGNGIRIWCKDTENILSKIEVIMKVNKK